jgi:hypothetical protein
VFASDFRSKLAERTTRSIAFHDAFLDAARFDPARDTGPFVRYLQERFDGRAPDLVLAIAPPAAGVLCLSGSQIFALKPPPR